VNEPSALTSTEPPSVVGWPTTGRAARVGVPGMPKSLSSKSGCSVPSTVVGVTGSPS
jgi:hypothetical protein